MRFIYFVLRALVITSFATMAWGGDVHSLKLVWEAQDGAWPILDVAADGKIFVEKRGESSVPEGSGGWMLTGNLRERPELLHWSPRYRIARVPEKDLELSPGKSFGAVVSMHLAPASNDFSSRSKDGVRRFWPSANLTNEVLVCVWIVSGMVVHADAKALREGMGTIDFHFALAPAEAAGQPVCLLWSNGAWIAPEPLFSKVISPSLVTAAMLDDSIGLETAVLTNPAVGSEISEKGYSLLHLVAEAGAINVVRALVNADPRSRKLLAEKKTGVMDRAAENGRLEVVTFLTSQGFKSVANSDGRTALHGAAGCGHTNVVEALLKAGAKVDAKTGDHRIPLLEAMEFGYADIVEILERQSGFRMQERGPDVRRVLSVHSWKGHTGMVGWLLAHGVDPNKDEKGMAPLASAAFQGHSAVVRLLLQHKAEVDWRDPLGNTALGLAVMKDHADCAQLLLEAGANPKTRNAAGDGLLHLAAFFDSTQCAELLLKTRAEREMMNASGLTPMEVALLGQNRAVADLLIHDGVRLDSSKITTKIMEAILSIDADILLKSALRDGWKADAPWPGGWSILSVARQLGASRCERVLIDTGIKTIAQGSSIVVAAADVEKRPAAILIVLPQDPRYASEQTESATVLVEFLIDGNGAVLFPKILTTPDPRISRALLEVVSRWKFSPAFKNGVPVATRMKVPVDIPASNENIFPMAAVDLLPKPISQKEPKFPVASVLNEENARVYVRFVVTDKGRVTKVTVEWSSSHAYGEAARNAILGWQYEPAKIAGRPVAVEMIQPITFTVRR